MALKRRSTVAGRRVPELDGPIAGRRRERLAVVRKRDRADRVAMALERLQTRIPIPVYLWHQ